MALIDQYPIYLTNSLTGKKEQFQPLHQGQVGMYVCGPTVYNKVHLGNTRTFLTFDIIARYFRFLGYKVRYVRNITDVGHLESDADDGEDKIAKKARLEQLEPMEIVKQYTEDFHEVMRQFNILPPSIEPSATGHIVEQISITEKLIKKGLAYEVNGSVYFDVKKYNQQFHYGILSGRKIEELMESGRELDSQDEKREKIDFALWKKASPSHIMRWPSPWGEGFPGWHIECTVMSTKYLGETFDIHGGGMDLKFPHHECEIAQATGANGQPPVKYWIHSNMLTVNGQKMSKSLGNSFLPAELFSGNHALLEKGYSPSAVRFFMLQSHYSSTLDFSNEALQAAEKGYKKLSNALKTAKQLKHTGTKTVNAEVEQEFQRLTSECYLNMGDDFNTARTLAVLFEMASRINDLKSGNLQPHQFSAEAFDTFLKTYIGFMEDVLGLQEEAAQNDQLLNDVVNVLIGLRKKARQDRNYALSDKIRDDLKQVGVQLMDGKDGEMSYSIDS
ncbi:cysteine--tRNA ligase [Fulvivirgaceae bacterium PWU4]|uniref:Cysteine--tRNA ligase n=1 Tax=Chryseosolibacter histidini TaxID=2782349 RepID=A0AAP2DQF9_9BACT|nr:cysteine--tRNA ligase [Chryseosolibacter histidini]MBT1700665.1 cysteine--tRNA ligase [Chryseosolibacter histidini]